MGVGIPENNTFAQWPMGEELLLFPEKLDEEEIMSFVHLPF
jgi:hypothetical protein